MSNFYQAVQHGDSEGVQHYVDFPSLRANLKDQLNDQTSQAMMKELKDNPFGGLGAMLGTILVDRIIDTVVTPKGIMT